MPEKDTYNMKLHESRDLTIGGKPITVVRVPSGWLYIYQYMEGRNMVFVPFSDEFMVDNSG